MRTLGFWLVGFLCVSAMMAGKSNSAEPGSVPPPSWRVSGGISYFQFDPNLPRDLIIHETHPDDQAFLSGSAGETQLDKVDVTLLNVSIERTWSISHEWSWGLCYVFKLPLQKTGREDKQNENDFRPATEGSFIYTEVKGIDPAHEIGLNVSYQWFTESEINCEIRPGVFLGYWQMDFEKGWDRFGLDETALASGAKGFSISPQLSVTAGMPSFKIGLTGAYRFINLEYDTDVLGSKVAQGWELGGGFSVRF